MEHLINQWVSYNHETHTYSYSPWYSAKGLWGGRLVAEEVIERVGVPSYLGIAWEREDMRMFVMYPKPLHLVARLMRKCYWEFMRFFYWIGLIDTKETECFRWADFYRIKVHS